MEWQILESGEQSPQELMDRDQKLLEQQAVNPRSILHFYEWAQPCLTYGYFIDPTQYLNEKALQSHNLKLAKRPTGGGIIFHLTDFAFSLSIPASHPRFSLNTLDNYAFINGLIAQMLEPLIDSSSIELLQQVPQCLYSGCNSFCMAKPTQYDLIVQGKKLGGAAQRRTKFGLLHQGSISLAFPPLNLLEDVLKNNPMVLQAMQQHTYSILKDSWTTPQLLDMRKNIKNSLQRIKNNFY